VPLVAPTALRRASQQSCSVLHISIVAI
jgi:hypothetical protein